MALKRVTIQDIANACGLSRNTVSKVFNGRGAVQDATKQLVLKKARELGYFQLITEDAGQVRLQAQNVALLTRHMPREYHFGTSFIPAFAAQLSRAGYTLMMYEISDRELRQGRLPAHINLEKTAALLSIELFDQEYIDMLCGLGLPVLMVDGYYGVATSQIRCDRISMENVSSTIALVDHLISKGARRIGFVGDPNHCSSFRERWFGLRSALLEAGLSLDEDLCILDEDDSPYHDPAWLTSRIRGLKELPDAFVCVNDFIAIHVMTALKQLGISIPGQVMVTGFDGTAQSAVVEPPLTTVEIPSTDIGRIAADLLINRIMTPGRPPISIYMKTTPVLRESTNREPEALPEGD